MKTRGWGTEHKCKIKTRNHFFLERPEQQTYGNRYTFFLLRFYLFIFRERGREGQREGETHQCVVASQRPPTGDPACNPGMCPGWDLNPQPFCSRACTQSTELHQPGLDILLNPYFLTIIIIPRGCCVFTCIISYIYSRFHWHKSNKIGYSCVD